MTPEMLTAILGAGGLGAILPKVVDGVSAWLSGRAGSEKSRNQALLRRLHTTEARAESEAEFRRQLEEYAGALRLLLVNSGTVAAALPPWPARKP